MLLFIACQKGYGMRNNYFCSKYKIVINVNCTPLYDEIGFGLIQIIKYLTLYFFYTYHISKCKFEYRKSSGGLFTNKYIFGGGLFERGAYLNGGLINLE